MSEKCKLKIRFGQSETGCPIEEKYFNTPEERQSYLDGIADMDGWEEYEIFNDEEDKEGEPRCLGCGNKEFVAHQVCRVNVIVDANNMFLCNDGDDFGGAVYESNDPFGPYICTKCNRKYDDLSELTKTAKQG